MRRSAVPPELAPRSQPPVHSPTHSARTHSDELTTPDERSRHLPHPPPPPPPPSLPPPPPPLPPPLPRLVWSPSFGWSVVLLACCGHGYRADGSDSSRTALRPVARALVRTMASVRRTAAAAAVPVVVAVRARRRMDRADPVGTRAAIVASPTQTTSRRWDG